MEVVESANAAKENEKLAASRVLVLLGYSGDVDRVNLISNFKKGIRTRFSLITPDGLIEGFKKRVDYSDELKKLNGKDPSKELLLRLLTSKLEDEYVVKKDESKAHSDQGKSASKKKKKLSKEEESNSRREPDIHSEANTDDLSISIPPVERAKTAEKKNLTVRNNVKKIVIADDYPQDGPESYTFVLDCIKSIDDFKHLREKNIVFDSILHLKRTETPLPSGSLLLPLKELMSGASVASMSAVSNVAAIEARTTLMRDLKNIIEEARDPVFANTIWTELEDYNTKDPKNSFDDIARKVYEVVGLKSKYTEWMKTTSLVSFPNPSLRGDNTIGTGYHHYDRIMSSIPEDALSVPLILNAILEEVTYEHENTISTEEQLKTKTDQLASCLNSAFGRLSFGQNTLVDAPRISQQSKLDTTLLSEFDQIGIRTLDKKDLEGRSINLLEKSFLEKNLDYPRFNREGMMEDDTEMETKEELEDLFMERREFLSHSSLPAKRAERGLLLFEFEDIVNDNIEAGMREKQRKEREERMKKEPPKRENSKKKKEQEKEEEIDMDEVYFGDRDYEEYFTKDTMVQVLYKALRMKPQVISQYYPHEDALLVALNTSVPEEKINSTTTWKSNLLTRTGFAKWLKNLNPSILSRYQQDIARRMQEKQALLQNLNAAPALGGSRPKMSQKEQEVAASKEKEQKEKEQKDKEQREREQAIRQELEEKEVAHSSMYDLEDDQVSLLEDSTTMYPSSGALIKCSKIKYPRGLTEINVRVYSEEAVFGSSSILSSQSNDNHGIPSSFVASFEKDLNLWIGKEDGVLKNVASLSSGLVVIHSIHDHSITQVYLNRTSHVANGNFSLQIEKADIPRLSLSSSNEIEVSRTILMKGTVVRHLQDGSKEIIYSNGNTTQYKADFGWIMTAADGARRGRHVDGSEEFPMSPIGVSVKTDPETKEVLTIRQDMLSIKKSIDGTLVVKGPDGTAITTTRILNSFEDPFDVLVSISSPNFATINIRPHGLKYHSSTLLPGGVVITAMEDSISTAFRGATVELKSNSEDVEYRAANQDLYKFGLENGRFQMIDVNNTFEFSEGASKAIPRENTIGGDDQPDKEDEYVSHPQRLFVLKDDGSGRELLRSKEANQYIQSREKESTESKSKDIQVLMQSGDPTHYTILTKSSEESGRSYLTYRQLTRYQNLTKEEQEKLLDELEIFDRRQEESNQALSVQLPEMTEEEKAKQIEVAEKLQQYLKSQSPGAQERENLIWVGYQNQLEQQRSEEEKKKSTEKRKQEEEEEEKKRNAPRKVINHAKRAKLVERKEAERLEKPIETLNYFEFEDGLKFLEDYQKGIISERPIPKAEQTKKAGSKNPSKNSNSLSPPQSASIVGAAKDLKPVTPPVKSLPKEQSPISSVPSTREYLRDTSNGSSILRSPMGSKPSSSAQTSKVPASTKDLYGRDRTPPALPTPFLQTPGELNTKRIETESGARRKVQTSSVKLMDYTQLFAVYPTELNFGNLKEGNTYRMNLHLTNVGFDTGRFKVKPSPLSKVRVTYLKGPVAPGISVKIEVDLSASQQGPLSDEIKIETENETFGVKINAIVVDQNESINITKGVKSIPVSPSKSRPPRLSDGKSPENR